MADTSLLDSMNKTTLTFRQDVERNELKEGFLKRIESLEREVAAIKQSITKKQKGV